MSKYVKPKKHLGQHFLHDRNIAAKIAEAIPDHDLPLLEIGPGTGMLTRFLLTRQNPLKVIEIDHESVEYLRKNLPELTHENIIEGDFLTADLRSFYNEPFGIVGNFPYNISSQILFRIVENLNRIPILCGMFQKEVAQRIASPHGNKQYGILSVLIQTWYDVRYLFSVGENAFTPPPKVQSGVILLTSKTLDTGINDIPLYFRVVKAAFNQRRKMLRNALQGVLGPDLNIPFADKRAEQLSVEDFKVLCEEIRTQKCC
jgi:16S rRNA (adenine1518-N6/adenine1519-N6)-dimethyltransferase